MIRTIVGDARSMDIEDGSVQCVVTSPPYWGLRSYLPGMVKLRNDLSPEEIKFVLFELQKLRITQFDLIGG